MLKYRFLCERQVEFGQAIYLSGNIEQLGSWKLQDSIQLKCYQAKHWFCDIQIPLQTDIQYKFFVSKFKSTEGFGSSDPVFAWIGNSINENFSLFISREQGKLLEHERKSKDLRLMSFNVRAEKSQDVGEYSWENRKLNCVKVITEQLPSIVGLQQANPNQQGFIQRLLEPYYQNVTVGNVESGLGMLYNRQRFLIVETGSKQIPQKMKQGQTPKTKVFDFTIFEDTFTSSRFIHSHDTKSTKKIQQYPRSLFFVGNIYLDYHSMELQKIGLQLITEQMKQKSAQYKDELKDLFILGDFNLPENSHLMHNFQKGDVKMESIRKNFLRRHMKDQCDLWYTFQAFQHDLHEVQNPNKIIDHLYISTKDYQPTKFEVIRSIKQKGKHPKNAIISDHHPIMGIFKHKKEEMKLNY